MQMYLLKHKVTFTLMMEVVLMSSFIVCMEGMKMTKTVLFWDFRTSVWE